MQIGIVVPQGWTGEFAGWDERAAWRRTLALATTAEQLGFESLWVYDHFQTTPTPVDTITFESFTVLAALAQMAKRVRLGHLVISAGFRNPALVAKMIGTLDVISGGRVELGIGAGWKQDEWEAYGYGYPPIAERMARLADCLEVLSRMLKPGRSSYQGLQTGVCEAINVPHGCHDPHIPIVVGGNGRQVTWRLAARFADELNLNMLAPDAVAAALPVISRRCKEIGRDPSTLRVSLHLNRRDAASGGTKRAELLQAYRELGLHRVQAMIPASVVDDDALPPCWPRTAPQLAYSSDMTRASLALDFGVDEVGIPRAVQLEKLCRAVADIRRRMRSASGDERGVPGLQHLTQLTAVDADATGKQVVKVVRHRVAVVGAEDIGTQCVDAQRERSDVRPVDETEALAPTFAHGHPRSIPDMHDQRRRFWHAASLFDGLVDEFDARLRMSSIRTCADMRSAW